MPVQFEKLSEAQKGKLKTYIEPFITANAGLSDHRARLEMIDRLIERSYSPNKKEACRDNPSIPEPPEEENITVPVVGPQIKTISAQLVKIFLRTDPPLQMFGAPAGSPIANQYNIIYGKYSRAFQWRRNLIKAIQDATKYNFCAAEISWAERAVKSVQAGVNLNTGGMRTAAAFESGEAIRHLDPYNVIWDGSVPLNEVAQRGAYAGYIQRFTKIALYQYCRDAGIELTSDLKEEITKVSPNSYAGFFKPEINAVPSNDKAPATYDSIWDGDKKKKDTFTSTDQFDLHTLYLRIIPADFDILNESGADINILKLHVLNGQVILAAQILDNAHNLIPIVFGQTEDTSLGLNSFTIAEELDPIQNTATKLYRAEIASTRRMIADRAIYDSNLINEKDVNNPSPTAKIRLRRSLSQGVPIQSAYYPIPYEDRAMGVRLAQANQLLSLSSPIAGTNPAMEGQFIKGNKTAGEFNTIMASAGDRILLSAIFMDDQFFSPLRTILLSDTLQYQGSVRVFDKTAGDFIEIDMTQLREQPLDFEIAAGLIPAEDMASSEFLQVLIQTFMARPDLNMEFKPVDALCYLAEMKGVKYLSRFIRSDAEKQQMLQQQMAMMQMQQAQNQNTDEI